MSTIEKNVLEWFLQLKKHRKVEPKEKVRVQKEPGQANLKEMIKVSAYFISHNELSYDELC